jgi:hypothetical protein
MVKLIPRKKTSHLKYFIQIKIFGLDYMIDEDFKVSLIEINTNPCFELGCTLLSRIIPNMINNALMFKF